STGASWAVILSTPLVTVYIVQRMGPNSRSGYSATFEPVTLQSLNQNRQSPCRMREGTVKPLIVVFTAGSLAEEPMGPELQTRANPPVKASLSMPVCETEPNTWPLLSSADSCSL